MAQRLIQHLIQRLIQRAAAFSLAAVLTLGMLGGIDQLSQPGDGQAAQWAQQAASAPRG